MTSEAPSKGTIIIAAHNEAAVIDRTLDALCSVLRHGHIRVVVVCNGCTDSTAEIARKHQGVVVVELAIASKTAALREGDRRAGSGPRIYLDADVVLTSRAATDVVVALSTDVVAGRPPHIFDTGGASWIVRSWYRARASIPSIGSNLWGAGCYALSEEGRNRFDEFPEIVSDDLFIHSQFSVDEIAIIETDPIIVKTPRRTNGLLRILRRSYRSQPEVAKSRSGFSVGQREQLRDLTTLLVRAPWRFGDVVVYLTIIGYGRFRVRTSHAVVRWERDESSRELC